MDIGKNFSCHAVCFSLVGIYPLLLSLILLSKRGCLSSRILIDRHREWIVVIVNFNIAKYMNPVKNLDVHKNDQARLLLSLFTRLQTDTSRESLK